MARLPRLVVPNHLHHVIARGNNEQSVFIDEADYQQYLDWLRDAARKYRVAIHAYALLPNRVQLLVTPSDEDGLGKMMQAVGRLYVPYFNTRHRRSGSLWEGRFRATVIDAAAHFADCAHLLEHLPVQSGLSADMASYPWVVPYERYSQDLNDFPHLKRWFEAIKARPAVAKVYAAVNPSYQKPMTDEEKKILFGQTAKSVA